MVGKYAPEVQPVAVRFKPLFEARWAYDEFVRLMPLGAPSEGQAYAYSTTGCVSGESLSGSLELMQYPRVRADGVLLPDAHGLVRTESGEQMIVRAGGFGVPEPDAPGHWTITHWMRFWTAAPALTWLNGVAGFGIGTFADDEARLRYFAATPAIDPADPPAGAPKVELLGTAQWEYPEYESVRPFGDVEGVGFARSIGSVDGGPLVGAWRGWHYPSYLRDGLYQIDAHVEVSTAGGIVLLRHGGLATRSPHLPDDSHYEIVQHATFVTEIPELAALNQTLAIGVGITHDPGVVTLSYYGLRA